MSAAAAAEAMLFAVRQSCIIIIIINETRVYARPVGCTAGRL